MVMNPNAMMELVRLQQQEMLAKARRARLCRPVGPDEQASEEPPDLILWRDWEPGERLT